MKNLLLICLIFLFGKLTTSAQIITFDDQGYTNNQALGNPYSINNAGETFIFTIVPSGSGPTDNIYRTDENSCGSSGLGHLYAGNFSATRWTIETSSGNEIDLRTIRFDNVFSCFSFSYNLTIEGFKNGNSTGTQGVTVSGLNTIFNSNSSFDDVDVIVITASDLANLGIDDIEFSVILPVELVSFEGRINNGLELYWQTVSELNNEKFEIQESADGIIFEKIGTVKGKGTTLQQQQYSFAVENPKAGLRYYRLKQIDYDGQFEYSKIISLDFDGQDDLIGKIYPNPSKPGLVNLDYSTQKNEVVTVSVFDRTGRLVLNTIQSISKGDGQLTVDCSTLQNGIYILEIGNEKKASHQKLIIEK